METLRALPVIEQFLEKGDYIKALAIVRDYIETLAPYINFDFPDPDHVDPEVALVLCRLYLLKQQYSRAIEYGMRAKNLLKNLDLFYAETFIFRTMEELLIRCKDNRTDEATSQIRDFVISYISNDETSDALLGYLASIKDFEGLKKRLVNLSKTQQNSKDILSILMEIAEEEVVLILAECEVTNPTFFENVIDALVSLNQHERLKELVSNMPWDRKYAACFYLEDTLDYSLKLDDENANLILSGQWKQEIVSNFLFKNNKTNFKFLESMSKARAPYMALANSFMNAGTTNDSLYRNNKNLIAGKDWNRFLEFASLGMIHHGNFDPFEILKELLPSLESNTGEAGALMALGLMNAGRNDEEATEYYMNWINNAAEEIVFGSCIGIGLNAMETSDGVLFEKIKGLFARDSTIIHESALYAIGLIYMASENKEVSDFIMSIHENTDFSRVKRVCGFATGLINCLATDRLDLFENLSSKQASIRSMALLSLGCAYVATSNLQVIGRVLELVNDNDDETKRSAVIALALVGYGDDEIKHTCIMPLAENHNPFVRATAAVCLGLFNSGVCDIDTCSTLEAMMYDSDELVKQNACIGAGFALIQGNPTLIPNYKRSMDRINYIISSRNESQCAKIGASLGRSIAESAGRSAVFSLKNFSGQIISTKVASAMLFLQSWYWYPLIPCISLCMHPTPIYFFDQNLDETSDTLEYGEENYDYLVKLPEMKKSRKFKPGKAPEQNKDILEPAKEMLKSGDKMNYRVRISREDLGTGILFKAKK